MMRQRGSLGLLGATLMMAAFGLGLLAAGLWLRSDARWEDHLSRAYYSGELLYGALSDAAPHPENVKLVDLPPDEQALADRGMFQQLPNVPRPALVTNISILETVGPQRSGKRIELAILAQQLRYPVAEITSDGAHSPQGTLGAITRILARYCSEPVIFAHLDDANWVRIDGSDIWGCNAAPKDHRLLAAVIAAIGLGIILTLLLNITSKFSDFAALLRSRTQHGGPERYEADGPAELIEIVEAVNAYRQTERDLLEKRVMVLSGVSHDIGTPATRMRLRAELIDDPELRGKLQTDIDQLTGIIESVLTYTRAEIGTEEPRKLSLTSLVESLVSDYSDTGQPVTFSLDREDSVAGGRSVFMSRQGHGVVPDEGRIIVNARPVSLQRALSNLIDNALKYGRRATVSLTANAETATIIVEDEGSQFTPEDLEELLAPYQRGSNARTIPGFGLGLTIVGSIARLHGGALSFSPGKSGLRAKLVLQR